MRGVHDIGGLPEGPIDRSEHELAFWEKRVHALAMLLGQRGVVTTDEMRRSIEGLGEAEYNRLGYYQRWIASLTGVLLEKGLLTPAALGRRLADLEAAEGGGEGEQ